MKLTQRHLLILVLFAVCVQHATEAKWWWGRGRKYVIKETYKIVVSRSLEGRGQAVDCNDVYVPSGIVVNGTRQRAAGYKSIYINREMTEEPCNNRTTCAELMSKMDICNDGGICYNFILGQDSTMYKGIGWDYIGDTTVKDIGIAVVGKYTDSSPDRPNDAGIKALRRLIDCGLQKEKLSKYVTIKTAKGTSLYKIIQTWMTRHMISTKSIN